MTALPPPSSTSRLDTEPAWIATTLDALCAQFAQTAVERDRAGGHAAHERELIRHSGLLHLTTPTAWGGHGLGWAPFYRTLRRMAEVDSALAHLYAFHHLQVATIQIFGTASQQDRLLTQTTQAQLFWGNALNPSDRRATATATPGGFRVHGPKSYCSGSVGADRLTLSAWHAPTESFLIAVVDARHPGVRIDSDWDAFGQKQTDSGSVHFDEVFIPDADVLIAPGTPQTPWLTLRAQLAQHILGSLYVGLASGALQAGLGFARELARPWSASGQARAVDDPYTQLRYGELWVQVRAAQALSEVASGLIERAFSQGTALSAAQRGEVAVAVAEAKVVAHRAALEVTSRFFEPSGARAASGQHGLDRFWRNARVHTLHDPVDYKLRDLGRYALEGRHPEPTAYS